MPERIDTRDAFTPNSGRFGALLCPAARTLRYNAERGWWECDVDGDGKQIIRGTKAAIEELLDYLDNRQ